MIGGNFILSQRIARSVFLWKLYSDGGVKLEEASWETAEDSASLAEISMEK